MKSTMTMRKRQRIRLIILGVLVLIAASVAIGFGFRDSLEYYKSPTDIQESGAPKSRFRLGGLVKEGSLKIEGDEVQFIVMDANDEINVYYQGLLPDNFSESQGAIAIGKMQDGRFVAEKIVAKHDENYMPKEIADTLKEQGYYRE